MRGGSQNRNRRRTRKLAEAEGAKKIKEMETSLGRLNKFLRKYLSISCFLIGTWKPGMKWYGWWKHLPKIVGKAIAVREQFAFALNRRNGEGDRERAVTTLQEIIEKHGVSPETCGILGRVFKDRSAADEKAGKPNRARANLDEAIRWYRRGFEVDPSDYYPGINAATLLFIKGDDESLAELKQITPAVSFAVARRGGISSNDYWDVATVLEAAVLDEDWVHAQRGAERLCVIDAPKWCRESTVENLRLIRDTRVKRNLTTVSLIRLLVYWRRVDRGHCGRYCAGRLAQRLLFRVHSV